MTLTATNDTTQDVTVSVGPSTNVFSISQNGKVVWRSNEGYQPDYEIVAKVLGPGQSLTMTASWTATATGTFAVSSTMAPQGTVATFTVVGERAGPRQPASYGSPAVTSARQVRRSARQLHRSARQLHP